ncbi:MAG TPA: hypothetical protein VHN99_01070, partial [Deinococcales bacterium]|nr:hypothetical protein [Deinococcales bacterium]
MTWRPAALLALLLASALAQSDGPAAGRVVDLQALALANGGRLADGPDRATLRLPDATAIVFDQSNRVLVNGVDVVLDAPVRRVNGLWSAPESLADALHLTLPAPPAPAAGALPPLALNWERLDLGHGLPGLHLFLRAPGANADDASLVLADLNGLPTANPNLAASVHKLAADFPGAQGRLVYYSVVADPGVALPARVVLHQNGQTI